jgi:hypothetical protein
MRLLVDLLAIIALLGLTGNLVSKGCTVGAIPSVLISQCAQPLRTPARWLSFRCSARLLTATYLIIGQSKCPDDMRAPAGRTMFSAFPWPEQRGLLHL